MRMPSSRDNAAEAGTGGKTAIRVTPNAITRDGIKGFGKRQTTPDWLAVIAIEPGGGMIVSGTPWGI